MWGAQSMLPFLRKLLNVARILRTIQLQDITTWELTVCRQGNNQRTQNKIKYNLTQQIHEKDYNVLGKFIKAYDLI
jgi:hypothetical protein